MRKKGLGNRYALMMERFNKKVEDEKDTTSGTDTTFKTHTLSHSEAEILLPPTYASPGRIDELMMEITVGKCKFYAEITENSYSDKTINEPSILQNLITLQGVSVDSSGTFKGKLKAMNRQKIPSTEFIEYAEIVVKNIYFSRRDQYKVLQTLKDTMIHVYNRKTIYFDKLKLQVTNLLRSNQKICKSGIINKNTKIIFRSYCSKYTILIEISKEMFQLNQEKELYLEKAIHFLLVFFQRINAFGNRHRIEIVLFARLFYPQFKTLKEAYDYLIHSSDPQTFDQGNKNNANVINHAVALQKDFQGRIFQDVYRRILWPGTSVKDFRQDFWERVSEFMYTVNWDDTKTYAKNINESLGQTFMDGSSANKKNSKMKPFLHRLKSQVSSSEDSCFFQAISLIAEQYKHHYYFRSLEETGNAITVVSAGKSFYRVDHTTYKMAKSNVYLTNISCIHINLKRKQPAVRVKIMCMKEKPRYQKDDIEKLKQLVYWCIEEEAYLSPTNILIDFSEDFQLKSVIHPKNLVEKPKEEIDGLFDHACQKEKHFIHLQDPNEEIEIKEEKDKRIEWVETYYMNEKAYTVHTFFYDNLNFQISFNRTNKKYCQESELATFERDLQILMNKKSEYNFKQFTKNSQVMMKVEKYRKKMTSNNYQILEEKDKLEEDDDFNRASKLKIEPMDFYQYQNYFLKPLFEITSLEKPSHQIHSKKKMMTTFNTPEKGQKNDLSFFFGSQRKGSDQIFSRSDDEIGGDSNSSSISKKQNILEATIQNKGGFNRNENNEIIRLAQKKKQKSHNKERLNKNYKDSNLHYMMSFYKEQGAKWLERYLERPEPRNEEEKMANEYLQLQKEWKNIIFPILTPIYTNYRVVDKEDNQVNPQRSKIGIFEMENEISKKLMENFQIQTENSNLITMSKGHVHISLDIFNELKNPTVRVNEIVQKEMQKKIMPNMLYRYLCYEEKDYRFGSKSIIFSNQNFYSRKNRDERDYKKALKLVLMEESITGNGSCFKQFIKLLSEKYKEIKLDLSQDHVMKQERIPNQNCKEFTINLARSSDKIYKKEEINVIIDSTYHPQRLFQVHIEWDFCCATFVQEFFDNVISGARRTKLNVYQTSRNSAFDNKWTITTLGQIIFESSSALLALEEDLTRRKQWLWDSLERGHKQIHDEKGYYMSRNGEAFIRFNHGKKLIEWKDNLCDKNRWKKYNGQFYESFFMKAAAYDFLGRAIESFTSSASRKGSLALST